MPYTVQQISEHLHGRLEGDGTTPITQALPIEQAEAGHITFLESAKYVRHLKGCRASAVLIPEDMTIQDGAIPDESPSFIRVERVLQKFVEVVYLLRGKASEMPVGIHPSANLAPTAEVGPDCTIQANVSVGDGTVVGARCKLHAGVVVGRNCRIGNDVVLHPNVVVYDDTVLRDRAIVHSNSVIGADGFGYRLQAGKHVKIPQLGWVEIDEDVEIGALTAIDRGTFGPTRIGKGTKIDNHVQVGHNCQIGQHNLMAGHIAMAGSCSTGSYVVIAGQVGIADHVAIGNQVVVGARTAVHRDLADGERVLGVPAMPDNVARRVWVSQTRLPDLVRDMRKLKEYLGWDKEDNKEVA